MTTSGHNDERNALGAEILQFIERYEQLATEKKDIAEQQKELMAEAKGRGFDTKIMRKLIAERKRKPDEIAEEQAVLQLYRDAIRLPEARGELPARTPGI
jgi:uncharacterized protein (UPF0335 family)